ncbi:MAG TPA: N-acetylglutaminylglutamine synthetase [Gammaproteobacteria bacterium]|nr:N-acetylglutaminylglutamine synthetase [Gammaproteobacteria bacterium]
MADKDRLHHRVERQSAPSLKSWHGGVDQKTQARLPKNVVLNCGWGRLIFAHTFDDVETLADTIDEESPERRDIALYIQDPHVVLSYAPQRLFLDPSHTFRLWMHNYRAARVRPRGFSVRRLRTRGDAEAVNKIYCTRGMVEVDPAFVWRNRKSRNLTYLIAEDEEDGRIIGTVTGVDHRHAFDDPENGSSLWCLGVHPAARHPGVGEALVTHLADHYHARGRAFMDLSVMHDNESAIRLYEKLGFQRVPVFCVKHKNPINEQLFIGPQPEERLNPYATIIVDEARRRGIGVEVIDVEGGYFALSFGGRRIVCRESLSEMTTAVAMSRCDDKRVTRRLLARAGLSVPAQQPAAEHISNAAFLRRHGAVVVKPARGEQGRGISVNLTCEDDLDAAIRAARQVSEQVLLEEYVEGIELRLIVIGFKLVAAAVRRPPAVTGDGVNTIETLIAKQSRRRASATAGESRIPVDDETRRCIGSQGYELSDVLDAGAVLTVREAANLHVGGLLEDVTPDLNPVLRRKAEEAARALDIPVVGLDFIVSAIDAGQYMILEANERPGLANHEPQPTAERFVDLLFPATAG